jgi:hypothetical protein
MEYSPAPSSPSDVFIVRSSRYFTPPKLFSEEEGIFNELLARRNHTSQKLESTRRKCFLFQAFYETISKLIPLNFDDLDSYKKSIQEISTLDDTTLNVDLSIEAVRSCLKKLKEELRRKLANQDISSINTQVCANDYFTHQKLVNDEDRSDKRYFRILNQYLAANEGSVAKKQRASEELTSKEWVANCKTGVPYKIAVYEDKLYIFSIKKFTSPRNRMRPSSSTIIPFNMGKQTFDYHLCLYRPFTDFAMHDPSKIFVMKKDRVVKVFDLKSSRFISQKKIPGIANGECMIASGNSLWVGGKQGHLYQFPMDNEGKLSKAKGVRGHNSTILCMAENGETLATGATDRKISIRSLQTPDTCTYHTVGTTSPQIVNFFPKGGSLCLLLAFDKSLKVLSPRLETLSRVDHTEAVVLTAKPFEDYGVLYSLSNEHKIRLLDLRIPGGRRTEISYNMEGEIVSLTPLADKKVVIGTTDKKIGLMDLQNIVSQNLSM